MLSDEYKKRALERLKNMSAEQIEKILIAIGSVKIKTQESDLKMIVKSEKLKAVETAKKNVEEELEKLGQFTCPCPENSDARLLHFALTVSLTFKAMFDYIQALEEKRLDDPMCFENFLIENSKNKKNLLSKIETREA